MSREHIAGFMLGVSFGVAVGYFLLPTGAADVNARDPDSDREADTDKLPEREQDSGNARSKR